jgi:cation diffusion facilitator CzcD-associated flavoprotein CzcO
MMASAGGVMTQRNGALAVAAALAARCVATERELARQKLALERSGFLGPEDIVVIGCGFSGINCAIKLKEAGLPFLVIEKEDGVGGTWHLNRYPGAACDIPAHLYSFSFAPKMDWSSPYAPQEEIREYLVSVVDQFKLWPRIRLNTAVVRAEWDENARRWHMELSDGSTLSPRFVINAIGGLHHPAMPDVPGIDSFLGASMHSTKWRPEVDLKGKRVVVVGSAASAVQLTPLVAEQAAHLTVLQRTPNWISRKFHPFLPNEKYSATHKWLFQHVPGLSKAHRWGLYASFEALFWPVGVFDATGAGQALAQKVVRMDMESQLGHDKALIDKVVPKFGVGCKRICRANDYLPALRRPNVEMVAAGLKAVHPDGVEDATGRRIACDVIIYATGFKVGSIGDNTRIQGRAGATMQGTSAADTAMQAYLGVSARHYPNNFQCLGPNTGLGHNSVVLMIESSVAYIVRMLCEAVEQRVEVLEIKEEVVHGFNQWMDKQFDARVWRHGGCQSWYANKDGIIFSLWPASTLKFFQVVDNAPCLRESYELKLQPGGAAELQQAPRGASSAPLAARL